MAGSVKQAPDFALERAVLLGGGALVLGVDEAGRGPWAGPVAAGAVRLVPQNLEYLPEGLNDSKKMTESSRQKLYNALLAMPDSVSAEVAMESVEVIDSIGILQATFSAMDAAVVAVLEKCDFKHQDCRQDWDVHILVDGSLPPPFPEVRSYLGRPPIVRPIIKGDARCLSIASASLFAKVHRDAVMIDLARGYSAYGWADNKGYGTERHRQALAAHGITPHHRRSFKPIARLLEDASCHAKKDKNEDGDL